VVGSNPGRATSYPQYFRGFPQTMQANAGAIPRLGNDCLLPNAFQFIIRQSNATASSKNTENIRRYGTLVTNKMKIIGK
jgi:hypothetical protein